MKTNEGIIEIGRISKVDCIVNRIGLVHPVWITFEREKNTCQKAQFEFNSDFGEFMKACDATTTGDLVGVVCKLYMTSDVNPVIKKIEKVFGKEASLKIY